MAENIYKNGCYCDEENIESANEILHCTNCGINIDPEETEYFDDLPIKLYSQRREEKGFQFSVDSFSQICRIPDTSLRQWISISSEIHQCIYVLESGADRKSVV